MPPAIEFRGVDKWFGKLHVLRGIDLAVETGEVVVVCGPSGSGKSTRFSMSGSARGSPT
jgi:polar amino acid transport system ATP-binding protein